MNQRDPLPPLLQTWRHQPPDAPDFNAGVWARVRAAQRTESATATASAGRSVLHFPVRFSHMALPLAASFAVLLALVAGSGAALAYNSITREDRMATAYAKSIDPLQRAMPEHAHP